MNTTGHPAPLGATCCPEGVNFSVAAREAEGLDLLLFDREDGPASRVLALDPVRNRSHPYWHVFVPGLKAGQIYAYRTRGTWAPDEGHRFDPDKILLDPYGRGVVVPKGYTRLAACRSGSNEATAMKSVVVDSPAYDWEGDAPLGLPASRTIIYEMHPRGFTRHPSSGVGETKRGTYAGLVEKIPYLQSLGVTAVELLPVYQFDPQDAPEGRTNYWGYAPVSFFAPHAPYSSRRDPLGPVDEFRDMVKALHRAGLEIILDVVYNHTAEGSHEGPTLCFRGLDNTAYYILEKDKAYYSNYTGTGNTLNANHPFVRRLILDSLRYWVNEMHVDGFRFDLASILTRDTDGRPLPNPPVLWDIDSDPVLSKTKIIAEAWDAAGLYQVGSFVGDRWKEWNGRFRDDLRGFFRGDSGQVGRLADRLIGSPDLYAHKRREAEASVNFITCHDGFTMLDLVSYNKKRNEANGEGNRDGADDNRSWNCGSEVPTENPAVRALRLRQIKNFHTATLLSLGVPMILMGDEGGRTQRGNNNAYCQDNELSWLDWGLLEKNKELRRFMTLLLARRRLRNEEAERDRLSLNEALGRAEIQWHGVKLFAPDWSTQSRSLALGARLPAEGFSIHWILNAYWEPLEFELPALPKPWRRWIDTGLDSPLDIGPWKESPEVPGVSYRAQARSVVVLFSQDSPQTAMSLQGG